MGAINIIMLELVHVPVHVAIAKTSPPFRMEKLEEAR